MRYIVFVVQNNDDGSVTFPSDPRQKVYDDINKAESEYHRILQYAAISTAPLKGCMLFTSTGELLRSEFYSHEKAPEPETEE